MSDASDNDIETKKRPDRGLEGVKNKKQDLQSLREQVIALLRADGFKITPPSDKRSAKNSIDDDKRALEIFTSLLEACQEIQDAKSKKKRAKKNKRPKVAVKEADTTSAKNGKKKLYPAQEHQEWLTKKKEARKLDKKKSKNGNKKKFIDIEERDDEKKIKSPSRSAREKTSKTGKNIPFPDWIRKKRMREILANQNPNDPSYVKGRIRINPKNFNHAYLNVDDGDDVDILIIGVRDRNRALDRDVVVAFVNPEEDWFIQENGEIQKTGTVVCILEKIHLRKAVGTLDFEGGELRLKSRDQRLPHLKIDLASVPKKVKSSPEAYTNTLFLAKIDAWLTPNNCRGTIESIIGEAGDLEAETTAILRTNGLNVTPYDEKLMKRLPSSDYVPLASDLEEREDWREECVFTIDPATAVDLDDAVSCKKLPNGNYEVGVHISDVTHYLKAFSPLDLEVSKRATTVYLVNTAYHMLPKSLCELCSLLPGREKLSFSVIWEMTPEAHVTGHRFAKSVIKSCYQMSYEKAQAMIEEKSRDWTIDDLPGLVGNFTPNHIRETVNDLFLLSAQMRERRYANGALSINQPKLQIILDKMTKIPISYRIEERWDSNRLIEEFMLLANMTVAKHLYETMSDTALLRVHGEPIQRVLTRTAVDLGYLGVHLNTESAASLQSSLSLYEKTGLEGYDEIFATNCRMMVINALCAQSMLRANYTCSGMIEDKEGLRHFALNVPFYTHFTSPIRRYADCAVHRLLFASMTNSPLPNGWSADLCAKIAATCNDKKYSAKVAQEKSNELYFMDLLSRKGPTETMAVVTRVKQRSMEAILCHVGITIKLSYSDFEETTKIRYTKEHSVSTVIVQWKKSKDAQTISVFSMINLRIEKHPKNYSIRGVLLPTRLNDPTTST